MSRPHNWMRVASLTTTRAIYPAVRLFASSWKVSGHSVAVASFPVVELTAQAAITTRAGDRRHHLVCRSCGLTLDVDGVTGGTPCLDAPCADGFVLEALEVTFWGTCPSCRT